jgi:hypothetical protein
MDSNPDSASKVLISQRLAGYTRMLSHSSTRAQTIVWRVAAWTCPPISGSKRSSKIYHQLSKEHYRHVYLSSKQMATRGMNEQ